MPGYKSIRTIFTLFVLLICSRPATVWAQAVETRESDELVNYAYSAILGTGYYKVGDQKVYVISLPFTYTQWKAGDGHRYGFKWLLSTGVGLNNFDWDDPVPDDGDDVATTSFLPGIELHFPLKSNWHLRPYAQYGFARDISNSEWSQVYTGGLKTRYYLRELTHDRMGITWGNRASIAGYKPDSSDRQSLGMLSTGIDLRWPQRWKLFNNTAWLGMYFAGNFYFKDAEFQDALNEHDDVSREFTVGLSVGTLRDFDILGVEFERVGIGYRFGPDIRAVTLIGNFPF